MYPVVPAASVDNSLEVFFDLVPTGAALYAPILDEQGDVIDFRFVRLNSAGQRLLGLPAQPPRTFREYYPHSVPTGIFGQYRAAYLTGQATTYDVPYQGDGIDTFFRLVAQRSGELLVVNFTDLADLPRSAVEQTLRDSQAAEQAARAEAEHQRNELWSYVQQASVAVVVYRGPQHRVAVANAAALAIWDRSWAQVRQQPVFEVLPEAASPDVVALFHHVFTTGEPYVAHELPTTIDRHGRRETVYWNFVFRPERQADGRISGILSVGTEVTEQVLARRQVEQLNQELEARVAARSQEARAAQAEAERQRTRLASFLAQAPAAVCVYSGPEFVYELVNAPYQALFGSRSLLGRPLGEALPEIVGQPAWQALRRVYETGQPHEEVAQLVVVARADGNGVEDRYFTFRYQPRANEHDQVDGVLVFAFEVTGQVQARQQTEALQAELLAAAEHRAQERQDLLRLFEQAPAAICLLREPDHQLDYFNAAFARLFPGEHRRGRRVGEAYPDAFGATVIAQLNRVSETGNSYTGREVPLPVAPDPDHPGQPRYFNLTYQAYREQGRIAGVAVFLFEVTEQVQARQAGEAGQRQTAALAEQLQQANAQLTRVNADLDTFVYTASHDLNAPITNLGGLLQVLQEEAGVGNWGETSQHVLTLMQDAIERFRTTLGHLIEVTRLQPEAEAAAPVDLADVVTGVKLDLAPLLAVARAQVWVEVHNCPALLVPAKTVRSVIYNLLSNALKYRAPERVPVVHIRCRHEGPQTVLEVEDNGLGMDLAKQTELFGMFRRYHTHVEGAGVGLYMVRRMVEHAGGRIDVRSQPGVGSTFSVWFPVTS